MNHYETRILNELVNSYENSLLARGENKINIHISVPFNRKTMPEYFDESSPQYEEIHAVLHKLEQEGLLEIVWRRGKKDHIVQKVLLNVENLPAVYQSLGRTPKSVYVDRHLILLEQMGKRYRDPVALCFIQYLQHRLAEGKTVKEYIEISDPERTEMLIRAVAMVEENTAPCYVREFSIKHFGDSKTFESLAGTVGKIFRQFAADRFAEADNKAVLAEYGIYHTPDYVYLKGEGRLVLRDAEAQREEGYDFENAQSFLDLRSLRQGIGLSGEDLDRVLVQGTDRAKRGDYH